LDGAVQIISCDNYFILGVKLLNKEMNICPRQGTIIFDSGSQCVYLLYEDGAAVKKLNDPFSALVHCRHSYLYRNSSLAEFRAWLKDSSQNDSQKACQERLTFNEERVVKAVCHVSSQKTMARMLNVSDKTISAHKKSGLRKLGIKNAITLHSIWLAWDAAWPLLSEPAATEEDVEK
jgi:hypothetical protein